MNKIITREEAIRIAKQTCETLGWSWLEPVQAKYFWGRWVVSIYYKKRDANAIITINGMTGRIIQTKYLQH
jgi:hypothetical protein